MSNTPLPANDRRVLAAPAAGTTAIAIDFGIRAESDVLVVRRRAGIVESLTLNADYVVVPTAGDHGEIQLTAGSIRISLRS